MIIKVEGQSNKPFRTAGNPIKMNAYQDIDTTTSTKAPALNQHREAILAEVMADAEAYISSPKETVELENDTTREANPWMKIKTAV